MRWFKYSRKTKNGLQLHSMPKIAQLARMHTAHLVYLRQCLGVEPWAYLQDVLTRLATAPAGQLGDLLPDHCQAARQVSRLIPPASTSEKPPPAAQPASELRPSSPHLRQGPLAGEPSRA